MALVTVAGNVLPTPSEYNSTQADIVDSGRNAKGVVVSQVVRSDVAKIDMTWKHLTVKQWSYILSIFKSSFQNSVTYFDQVSASYETRTFYVSDRKGGMAQMKNGEPEAWLGCSLSLTEV